MNDGLSREGVVKGFAQSPEFANNTAASFDAYMNAVEGDVFNGGAGNDTMAGRYGADTFVFDAADDGRNIILQLDEWDTVQLNGFRVDSFSDMIRNTLTSTGSGMQFSSDGVDILFAGADIDTLQAVSFEFG